MRRFPDLVLPWRTTLLVLLLQAAICLLDDRLAVRTRLPLLNLDVFLVLFFGSTGAVLGAASLIVGVVVVVSEIFGYAYIVFSIPELLNNLPYFPWKVQAAVYVAAFVAFCLLVTIPLCSRWERRRFAQPARVAWMPLAAIAGAFVLGYAAKFATHWDFAGSTYLTTRWELAFLEKTLLHADFGHAFAPLPPLAGHEALEAAARERRDIIVVIVESLGEFKDAAIQDRIDAVFQKEAVLQRYTVQQGVHHFAGSTIDGEFRELCDVELRSLFFKAVPANCLPARLAALGYRTEAFHGNDARFYRRSTWYPEIGLQRIIDLGQLPNPHDSHCGGIWDAYCDLDVLAFAGERGTDRQPRFTYVLTMNSHLPAEPMTRGEADLPGCRNRYPANVCTHLENSQRVLNGIAQFVVARAPATVLVVGDHEPPFTLESERLLFDADDVPYFLLQPK